MTLPNFVVIGAQKAGTTWLGDMLRQHPDVFVARGEPHFFDKDYNYRRGLAWYEQHFAKARGERAIGEKTPDYFWPNGQGVDGHRPDVHRLLHAALPDARLIVSLRDPVRRAVSAARHLVMDGWVSPFHRLDDLLVGRARPLADGHGVTDYGRYAKHLEAYFELYDRSRVLILVYEEDVVADPAGGLRKVCEFLGVDPAFSFRRIGEKRNELRKSTPRLLVDWSAPRARGRSGVLDRFFPIADYPVSEETIRRLREMYVPENEKLYALLGRRIAAWL